MRRRLTQAQTYARLGPTNIARVVAYRLGLKSGLHPVCKIKVQLPTGPFFGTSRLPKLDLPQVSAWNDSGRLFGYIDVPLNNCPPDWLVNPISGDKSDRDLLPWWRISDFDETTGDVKLIWEQSRMNWVLAFAQRARNGDEGSLRRLNLWLSDWIESNPPYLGPNWKCGQEASIRVMHLCIAALILGQERDALLGLQELIRMHLLRIAPTIHYAIAQNNNHGTSEASALFIGGSWLVASGAPDGEKYEKLGRRWLNNRASKLVEKDGSFSQYSLNYHRMVLDTFAIAEIWRNRLGQDRFSPVFYDRAREATSWLYQMVCPLTGHGPNLGANDGSHLLQLTDSCYRDFRPSVQLASNLFEGRLAYANDGLWRAHLAWIGIVNKETKPVPYVNCDYDSGGYKVLRADGVYVIFRYPKFRYRPSQADAMHVDLWVNGTNLLVDAGSYSYNSIPDMSGYFNGTVSHNTVQFDDRDQMPKLARFLFGNWLQTKFVSSIAVSDSRVSCSASYRDFRGAEHFREINLNRGGLRIFDEVKGFKSKAVIRWRLVESEWILENIKNGVQVSNGVITLSVTSDLHILKADVVDGWKSLFYMHKQSVPVLEVEFSSAGTISSEISWAS